MSVHSRKMRRWASDNGNEGLTYWCQGCESAHSIRTKGPKAWGWNGDMERPVFTPSVLTSGVVPLTDEQHDAHFLRGEPLPEPKPMRCHTYVGCNGAKPGEVIFLRDCTHALAGTVQLLPDLPAYMRDDECES